MLSSLPYDNVLSLYSILFMYFLLKFLLWFHWQIAEADMDDYGLDEKAVHGSYYDGMYPGEDGQLSWFNAGLRVGVGIGLGMCVGVGIGVGLLMRSYQATTRNLRRRFF